MYYFKDFDYEVLKDTNEYGKLVGKKFKTTAEIIISVDTETSKEKDNPIINGKYSTVINYVVAWTITILNPETDMMVTLYGQKPSQLIECIDNIRRAIMSDEVLFFIHNLAYDWSFIRRWCLAWWGTPEMLNLRSHYPIRIRFDNGIVLCDSAIIAQRSLEKWAKDLGVEHQKAVGDWDYNKIRHQDDVISSKEWHYVEFDTVALAECLRTLKDALGIKMFEYPYTATSIVRKDVFKEGKKHRAHSTFLSLKPDYDLYRKLEKSFHGGYTHANRFMINEKIENVKCYDFASSYPYCALAFAEFPVTAYQPVPGVKTVQEILDDKEYTYVFKLTLVGVSLKNTQTAMPILAVAKNEAHKDCLGCVVDNGRYIEVGYYEGYHNNIDLELIHRIYKAKVAIVSEVYKARKGYLPDWYRDKVYSYFKEKTDLKGSKDKVAYNLKKAALNSVAYGLLAMHQIKIDIVEDEDGYYKEETYGEDEEDLAKTVYMQYCDNKKSIFPYQWAPIITSLAQRNLFELGACVTGDWIYCDTDSVFATEFDEEKVAEYNRKCEERLGKYGPYKGYCLGKAELDKVCSEFKVLHSKCYCYNEDNELKITVAGVPKKTGKKCLDSIDDFEPGFIFDGLKTGKLTHTFVSSCEYWQETTSTGIMKVGNDEVGDFIDLTPCDYKLALAADIDKGFDEETLNKILNSFEEGIDIYE